MREWLAVLILSVCAHATVSCFANVSAPTGSTSSSINTTGATLLVAVSAGDGIGVHMNDSQNNVWQYGPDYGGAAGTTHVLISYVVNPTTSASHTFSNYTAAGLFASYIVYACSGTATSYPFVVTTGVANTGSGTFQPGSVTPVESGDLIVTGTSSFQGVATAAINSGFSTPIITSQPSWSVVAASFLVAPSGAAVNPTWTMSANTDWASTIVVFKSSAATPPTLVLPNISTFAGSATATSGNYTGDGGPATSATLNWPGEIVFDAAGNLYFADIENNVIRVVNRQQTTQTLLNVSVCAGCIRTVGGNGTLGFLGDTGAATSAELAHPVGMGIDSSGNLYIADQQNHRIRKISTAGIITTVAGSGASTDGTCNNGGFSGDGGAATSAVLSCPQGVTLDSSNNIYISDSNNNRIRVVNTQGTTQALLNVSICAGCIQTVAGSTSAGNTGDGGAATSALLSQPLGATIDGSGNYYFADQANNRIRKISTAGIITAFAGTGTAGYLGDGASATSALLRGPYDVKTLSGVFYIADTQNSVIRKVVNGTISTVAGQFSLYGIGGGYGGDLGPATLAGLSGSQVNVVGPVGVAVNAAGSIFIGDTSNNLIRLVNTNCGSSPQCLQGGLTFSGGITIK